jgi:hypothetical protein
LDQNWTEDTHEAKSNPVKKHSNAGLEDSIAKFAKEQRNKM